MSFTADLYKRCFLSVSVTSWHPKDLSDRNFSLHFKIPPLKIIHYRWFISTLLWLRWKEKFSIGPRVSLFLCVKFLVKEKKSLSEGLLKSSFCFSFFFKCHDQELFPGSLLWRTQIISPFNVTSLYYLCQLTRFSENTPQPWLPGQLAVCFFTAHSTSRISKGDSSPPSTKAFKLNSQKEQMVFRHESWSLKINQPYLFT